jgi:DNA (cytosine-5)-methyltransferase 1
MKKSFTGADLFCGAGGTSTGILEAADALNRRMELLAVNHWDTAINTHSLNHPGVRHLCETLENISPGKVIKGGKLDLLAASPECTHHSNAAGGRPKNEQSRATAWHICRWASDLRINNILIENVREFQNWGPLGANGKPLKSRKGETFQAFINSLRSLGFNVEHRVLNAADYGDPTSRQRLIVMARRGRPVIWPEVSHGKPDADLFGRTLQPFRTARSHVIDWTLQGRSIFRRKKALSPNTIRRIAAGLRKFGGKNAEPFLVILYGTNDARSVDLPAPTVTSGGGHIGLAEPFLVTMEHQGRERSIDRPLPVITTARGGAMGVCQPFITHLTHHGERKQHSVDDPCPTVTGAHRGELALIEPMLLGQQSGHSGSPVSQPCPTIATSGAIGLVEPFVVKYYGTGGANSLNEPLDTITTKDRFMLVEPRTGRPVAELDILFRMLQPHELAAAMSFPKGYKFTGNRVDQVKQIGNAVPVKLARACAMALLQT